jgi:hypothetical protein
MTLDHGKMTLDHGRMRDDKVDFEGEMGEG